MKAMLVKKSTAVLTALLLVMFQLAGLFLHPVSAAALKNAAMISVVDEKGNVILPQTAVEIKDGETAFDVLKEATSKKDVACYYLTDPKYGANVTKIGNSQPDYSKDGTYWGFIINGVYSAVGVSSYEVKNGDDLLFKVVSDRTKTVSAKVSAKDSKGNAIIPDTEVSLVDGGNAYDALVQASAKKNLSLNVSIDSSYFEFVQNIGNTKLVNGDYWKTAINDQDLQSALSANTLHDGDHVQLSIDNYLTPPNSNTDNGGGSDNTGSSEGKKLPAVTKQQISTAIKSAASYIVKNGGNDEFEMVALQKSGQTVPASYLSNIKQSLIDNNGTFRNVTDYERLAIGISAAGENAANINGNNLIEKIYNNDRMTNQGTNGVIYALLALDSQHYKVPSNAKWTREKLVDYLVNQQLNDGAWSLVGASPSVDITSMALAALAPYKNEADVKAAIAEAVKWLSSVQDENGGFSSAINGGDASETTSQVIIGLSTAGIDPTDKLFTKASGNLVQHLIEFNQKDGGFAHLSSDKISNIIATTQALIALTSYQQYLNGKGSAYQFPNHQVSSGGSNNKTASAKPSTDGQLLPNTATDDFNVLALGIILCLAGATVYFYSRKKRVQ